MESRFSQYAFIVAGQVSMDLMKTVNSGGLTLLDTVAFQRHAMVATGRACLNLVASGLSSEQGPETLWQERLATGVVGLSIIVPLMHVVTESSQEELWENMSVALQLFVSDCLWFRLLADALPALVLDALA